MLVTNVFICSPLSSFGMIMLVMQLGCYFLVLHFLLLYHFLISDKQILINPVQILAPPVRNRTISVLWSVEKGNIASFFWNYGIQDPDQICSGDGCSSSWSVEAEFTWIGTTEAISDYQHNRIRWVILLLLICIFYLLSYLMAWNLIMLAYFAWDFFKKYIRRLF